MCYFAANSRSILASCTCLNDKSFNPKEPVSIFTGGIHVSRLNLQLKVPSSCCSLLETIFKPSVALNSLPMACNFGRKILQTQVMSCGIRGTCVT